MRLFIAIDLPGELQEQVHRLQTPVRHVKWEPPERLHLTLQFLGEQPDHRVPVIVEALEAVEFSPFELSCGGIGHFRSGAIWLGIDENPGLMQLQRRIRDELRRYGIPFEGRRFIPHLTLARTGAHHLLPALDLVAERFRDLSFLFDCDTFCLKRSQLRPTGALHSIEALFAAS